VTEVAYYNEINPDAAEWLRQLIGLGAIAPGDVDERSIVDVPPIDLKSYSQHHFFAGLGVWSYALRQAGWPDARPVCTGSCPCQPFSQAGQGKGSDDPRDLWWAMFWHIQQLRPPTIFGEQVASKAGLGWWDAVQADLESTDYAATAFDLCAASVGAPHVRQRLFWVANANSSGWQRARPSQSTGRNRSALAAGGSKASDLANSQSDRLRRRRLAQAGKDGDRGGETPKRGQRLSESQRLCQARLSGFWRDTEWLGCQDGAYRAAKRGTFTMVDGVAPDLVRGGDSCIQTEATAEARPMRLRGYGNAIVAPLAVEFVCAYLESLGPRLDPELHWLCDLAGEEEMRRDFPELFEEDN